MLNYRPIMLLVVTSGERGEVRCNGRQEQEGELNKKEKHST